MCDLLYYLELFMYSVHYVCSEMQTTRSNSKVKKILYCDVLKSQVCKNGGGDACRWRVFTAKQPALRRYVSRCYTTTQRSNNKRLISDDGTDKWRSDLMG